ncbi:HAD family hydrolase [Sphingomonadaceae bacterium]|nr:HAD family hydrolase [Sphingomonadaceae bacterium]
MNAATPSGRPLVISDCDEVLLRMVAHFRQWLEESQGVDFRLEGNNFATAMRWQSNGEAVAEKDIWRFLGGFFDTEMHRQDPIAGALESMAALREHADVVVLTNLNDARQQSRMDQLKAHGLDVPVYTNTGPKGPALARILAEYEPSKAIFIDDLAQHHGSAKADAPQLTRLHLCGEPSIAPFIDCGFEAGHAHARIDKWDEALPWLMQQLEKEPA